VTIIDQMPLIHRIPFWFSWNGYRGSQFVWPLFEFLRKMPDTKKVRLPNTFPLFMKERDWISKTIYQGTYERPLLHFLNSLVVSDLVVDVGANIGVTLWHGLRNGQADSEFFAFEPSKQCIEDLKWSTSFLKNKGSVLPYAIGDLDGIQTLYGVENEAHSGGASFISHSGLRGATAIVEVRKLDSLRVSHFGGLPVSLLKIDTEGYESFVIAGANELLSSGMVEIVIMEVSPNFGDISFLRDVEELLGEKYLWFSLEESGRVKRKPLLHRISVEESLGMTTQWNLVLVRNDIFDEYCSKQIPIFLKGKINE